MTDKTISARAEAILAARHYKDQMEGDGAVGCFDAAAAVEELHAAGLLAPGPALPEGWVLADHKRRGRVVVSQPEPDADGDVVIVYPVHHGLTRTDVSWCHRDRLTYIAGEQEENS